MTKMISRDDRQYYQCEECALFYESKDFAEKCQAWCQEHKSCNLEIIAQATQEGVVELSFKTRGDRRSKNQRIYRNE